MKSAACHFLRFVYISDQSWSLNLLSINRLKLLLHLNNQINERLLNINFILGRSLQIFNPESLRKSLRLFSTNLPFIFHIFLISNQYFHNIFTSVSIDLGNPVLQINKRLTIGDVEHKQNSMCSLVI